MCIPTDSLPPDLRPARAPNQIPVPVLVGTDPGPTPAPRPGLGVHRCTPIFPYLTNPALRIKTSVQRYMLVFTVFCNIVIFKPVRPAPGCGRRVLRLGRCRVNGHSHAYQSSSFDRKRYKLHAHVVRARISMWMRPGGYHVSIVPVIPIQSPYKLIDLPPALILENIELATQPDERTSRLRARVGLVACRGEGASASGVEWKQGEAKAEKRKPKPKAKVRINVKLSTPNAKTAILPSRQRQRTGRRGTPKTEPSKREDGRGKRKEEKGTREKRRTTAELGQPVAEALADLVRRVLVLRNKHTS
ncbi:hypothetical protein EVG20_g11687 [Dentipellis fragilis]|uniref:Uncharacterized protein n=1 Tax=Dentipellis fragilis TaxID=205917 RepID=A0A4Y9XJJ4_9AGAM|nr:hypothetical protein EVG20_g11687 [Dentipellis fragilis]